MTPSAAPALGPAAPAANSAFAQHKQVARLTAGAPPAQCFATLLRHPATRCSNACRIPSGPGGIAFQPPAGPAPVSKLDTVITLKPHSVRRRRRTSTVQLDTQGEPVASME